VLYSIISPPRSGSDRNPARLQTSSALAIRIHIEQLPEGVYLATSDELSGLVAQGRTVAETLEIARDVARKLIEARRERQAQLSLPAVSARKATTRL